MLTLTLERSIPTAAAVSPNVLAVAGMFGLGVDEARAVAVVPRVTLTLSPHEVVYITGPSGSGKSTLMRLIADALRSRAGTRVIDFADLPPLEDVALVDALSASPSKSVFSENRLTSNPRESGPDDGLALTLRLLSLAGLGDAFVMLRSPSQLSDGQRYRLRLAQAMGMAEGAVGDAGVGETNGRGSAKPQALKGAAGEGGAGGESGEDGAGGEGTKAGAGLVVVLADEFGATLDRITARVIARNVRKWVSREPVCFVAATTHDDLLDDLAPDCVVEQRLGADIEVARK